MVCTKLNEILIGMREWLLAWYGLIPKFCALLEIFFNGFTNSYPMALLVCISTDM